MKHPIKLLFFVLLTTSISLQAQINGREKITGGAAININTRPFQISLQVDGGHHCGGSIINDSWVITAAHCVVGITADRMEVAVGITRQDQVGTVGQLIDVVDFERHGNYSTPSAFNNDIAIIQLAAPINYGPNAQPIRIINNPNQNLNDAGQDSFASGWGWTIPGTTSPSNQLMGVEIPVITNGAADAQLDISNPGHPPVTNNMIATGAVAANRQGPCHGDSGGPLTVEDNDGVPYLVGLVSWGVGGCLGGTNSPTIYTNVINYQNWIYDRVCQQNVLIDDRIHSDVLIEASNNLEVNDQVNDGLIVDFQAGNEVLLSPGFSVRAQGNGEFTATIGGNCVDVVPGAFTSSAGLNGNNNGAFSTAKQELKIYPNPTAQFLTVEYDQVKGEEVSFALYDLNGNVLRSESRVNELSAGKGNLVLDISKLPNGTYIYSLRTGDELRNGKVIKHDIAKGQ